MALSRINAHIGKYEKIAIPDKEACEALVALIERFVGEEVPISAIKIARDIAQIRVSPVIKNQILINEKKILEGLKVVAGRGLVKII